MGFFLQQHLWFIVIQVYFFLCGRFSCPFVADSSQTRFVIDLEFQICRDPVANVKIRMGLELLLCVWRYDRLVEGC